MTTHSNVEKPNSDDDEEEEAPIYGNLLEVVLSNVPLIDLVSASGVSRAWNAAVSSSLSHVKSVKPWLLLHSQSTRSPYAATAHAYDPRSGDWFQIHHNAPVMYGSHIRSSHSTLLFSLTSTRLAFSSDALRLRWSRAATPPLVSRTDPIVAVVGDRVVVAGGACDFGDDPIPVEIYNTKTRAWSVCDAIPAVLVDSAASTSLSIAVRGGEEMLVAERSSGLAHAFDPKAMTWRGPYDLRCGEESAFCSVAEFVGDGGLVAVGLIGSPESVESVKLRKFSGKSLEAVEYLGEMPKEIVAKFVGESGWVPSVSIAAKGSFVFLLNPSDPGVVIQCEIVDGGCRWTTVRNKAINDGDWIMQRLALGCADVDVGYLRRVMAAERVTFAAKV